MSLLYLLQIYNNMNLVRDLIRSAWINFITYGYFVAKWEDLVSRFTPGVYKPLRVYIMWVLWLLPQYGRTVFANVSVHSL